MATIKGKPIKPSEVDKHKEERTDIPPYVFDAFNELIVAEYRDGEATIRQDDVLRLIAAKAKEQNVQLTKNQVYENKWLDIEPVYKAAGWNVEYDKPGYNETYEPTFTFRKKRQRL